MTSVDVLTMVNTSRGDPHTTPKSNKTICFCHYRCCYRWLFLNSCSCTTLTDTEKAATAYWKPACDIKHGHVSRSGGGEQAEKYMRELGVSPRVAYADANAKTTAEMLDNMAGTNCFQ